MIYYDTEFYAFRFASAHVHDLAWPDTDNNLWTVVCRHDDALNALVEHVEEIWDKFPKHGVYLVRGGKRTFRHDLWPEYKANRKDRRKPPGYGQFLARIAEVARERGWSHGGFGNVEGDDVIGLLAGPQDIIVSGDKDMLTLPGSHYQAETGTLLVVTEWEADMAFYKQCLTGDRADNYPGCPGIADSNKLFRSQDWLKATTGRELWACVVGAYMKAGFDEKYALTQARCARILRTGEYDIAAGLPLLWKPPIT